MKKRKIMSIILSLFMCFCFCFLTACSIGNLENPKFGDDNGSSSGGVYSSDETEEKDPATSKYFDGVVILFRPDSNSAEDSFVDGVTNTRMKFNVLLDRQISMLADDILNRLVGVYGTGYADFDSSVLLKDKEDNNVLYNLIPAGYSPKNALATYDNINDGYLYNDGTVVSDLSTIDLTQTASWAYAFLNEKGTLTNSITDSNLFKYNFGFKNAINGFNIKTKTRTDETTPQWSFNGFNYNIIDDYKWNWNTGAVNIDDITTNTLFLNYKNNLKMALSSLLLTGEYDVNGSYDFDQTNYDNNLSNISHLGILDFDKKVIKDFIKDVIIGKDLIDSDRSVLDLLTENFDLTNFSGIEPDADTLLSMSEEELNNLDKMHTYKAYDLIVNAIVEQAVSNTFENTNAPIYAKMPRLSYMYMSWEQIESDGEETGDEFKTSTTLNINSVIILPKDIFRLNSAICFFESLTGDKDFYAKVNITFVAQGDSYTTSKNTSVKVGEQEFGDYEESTEDSNSPSGPNITPIPSNDNTFSVEASDFGEKESNPFYKGEKEGESQDLPFDTPDGMGSGNSIYEFTTWNPHDLAINDITTFNNPYTMEQTTSSSVAVFFNGGNNYMELSFEFFEDSEYLTPLIEVPEFSFGIIDFDFEWEDLN